MARPAGAAAAPRNAAKKRGAPATAIVAGGAKQARTNSSSNSNSNNATRNQLHQPPSGVVVQFKAEEGTAVAAMNNSERPIAATANTAAAAAVVNNSNSTNNMKDRFLQVFDHNPEYQSHGISNSALKELFGESDYLALAPVINELIGQSRLTMSKQHTSSSGNTTGNSISNTNAISELVYQLISPQVAQQFHGLDVSAKMVYQVIERAGNMGIWTKDIRIHTNIQQQALNKIFKTLESRHLIKPVKSVTAKSKKLYMLYALTPAKELTGGVWYSDLEFDHEFISELRSFLLQCVRRLNGGKGVTVTEILEKMRQGNISRVELSTVEVSQLVHTLIYDYLVEEVSGTAAANTITNSGSSFAEEPLYVAARKVTPMCEFRWWDALEPDFAFRTIRFEDGVQLAAHEPHYHTA